MYVSQGDVLTFDNGMVGTVTAHNRVALTNKSGWVTHTKHMPLLTNYNAMHRIVRIEERLSQDAPLELVWEDEEFFSAQKQHYHQPIGIAA